MPDDLIHMRRALSLAENGWGRVAPNPMVGALVVADRQVVGEGYHAEFGAPHAEVVALEAAGSKATGATLYVTLEPCHHSGKTGPCSAAIRQAGVARVVCATGEANPGAVGGGNWLRAQGIEVEFGTCEAEARDLNAIHLLGFSRGRSFLALKYAMSLDARLSESPGAATRVTSGEAVREVHRLRAGHDAVMVGIGTVLADDPQLTVREWRAPRVAPVRVVLDSDLRLPLDSMLAQSAADVTVLVYAAEGVGVERSQPLSAAGIDVERVPRSQQPPGLDLGSVFASLWERGIRSVFCEGGGTLGSALLATGRVDRLYAFIAPRIFGRPGVPAFQVERGQATDEWRLIERREFGSVTLLAMSPDAEGSAG
jgi:diaminohydroxyphosphoribosylaminopyrimidine deaminase/5-amino-6-(5-phosphoribosylamino)uracil reductase